MVLSDANKMRFDVRTFLGQLPKQRILNFVTAHPRLTTVFAGFGVALAFSSFGRFAVHEFTSSAVAPIFQVDYIDKTPLPESIRLVQHADAVPCCTCPACGASEFAPGIEAENPGDAQEHAPGLIDKSPGDAQSIAPSKEALETGDIGPPKKIIK